MDKELIKAIDVAKELGLYLKMVVSTKEYNNYNSFYINTFNINIITYKLFT